MLVIAHRVSEWKRADLPCLERIEMEKLIDALGRRFSYLRLSLTERCNFRCSYCLPNGYICQASKRDTEISQVEIRRLVAAFAEMGFSKVRLTGGEPTLRRDLLNIIEDIANAKGVAVVALSTNGFRLKQIAKDLLSAGVSALNVSVDSLNKNHYMTITGRNCLEQVLEGVDHALEIGFKKVKVNAVLLKDLNSDELPSFVAWVKDRPITLRLIELMETGENKSFFYHHHLRTSLLQRYLESNGWTRLQKTSTDGPAIEYSHPDYKGAIGLIAPYAENFCATCNRLRVNSKGNLRLCLFGNGEISLRHLLQDDNAKNALKQFIADAITEKAPSHLLLMGNSGQTSNLATIGG